MALDALKIIGDARVSSEYATLNGKKYHYLRGIPSKSYTDTVFLLHGWPDLSVGWRNQIPMLLDMGYRVVVPDMIGYGGTDVPQVSPGSPTGSAENVKFYSFKQVSDDIAELAHQLKCSRIILGGHDWGAAVVYRVALWHPELISTLFTVCVPYRAPSGQNIDFEMAVKTILPNFGYQLHLGSGEVETHIKTREQIKQFLNALYGGRGANGEVGFDVRSGPNYENLPKLRQSPLITPEILDFYSHQYEKAGIHGSLNWYRTRDVNYEEELELVKYVSTTSYQFSP